jgi:hypothetical protein
MSNVFAVLVTLTMMSWLPVAAIAQPSPSVSLTIQVTRRAYGDAVPKPFSGIGPFELHRNGMKMTGASCPDKSDQKGVVTCKITCQSNDAAPASIDVRPPSGQDGLAGWIVPPRRTVNLKGCVLDPGQVVALYEDARYALERQIVGANLVASGGQSVSTAVWASSIASDATALARLHDWAKTSQGREAIVNIIEAAAAASGSSEYVSGRLSDAQRKELTALTAWQIAAKNALLKAQAERALGTQAMSPTIKVTATPEEYFSNLKELEKTIEGQKRPNSDVVKFGDDVRTLRSLKSVGTDDLGKSVGVLRGWK